MLQGLETDSILIPCQLSLLFSRKWADFEALSTGIWQKYCTLMDKENKSQLQQQSLHWVLWVSEAKIF
jgi:hypothetical protein